MEYKLEWNIKYFSFLPEMSGDIIAISKLWTHKSLQ